MRRLKEAEKADNKNRLKRRLTASLALAAAVLFVFSGCAGPAFPGNETGLPENSDAQTTPNNGTEENAAKKGFSAWEDRTMEEILEVGGVTSVTSSPDVYDIRAFGLEPDERKDAAPEIKAAVEAVIEKGGGILYFPSGRYRLESPLSLEGIGKWVCLCGDVDGSSVFAIGARFDGGTGLAVRKDNTHLSFLSFEDASKNTVTVSVEADGCSLYGCSLKKTSTKAEKPLMEVSGSFDTVRQCSFWAEKKETCFVEFTKYPGRDAYGNVLCDVHFGGEFTKTVLVSSKDEAGSPENLTIFRNLFLISSDPMIEVRSVNGLVIANNMLDAAARAVGFAPEGVGVFNVEIRDNYIGASKGGIRGDETECNAGNISIHDNYIWSPESIIFAGKKYTGLTVEHNYFVLSAGNAVYMTFAAGAVIRENLVANIGSSEPELKLAGFDAASVIDTNGFGKTSVPAKASDVGQITVPEVKTVKKTFEEPPQVKGDGKAEINKKYVNVKDLGAVGDGTTDDTKAINDSIAKARAINGTVYFPEGTYLVKETVSVSKNDATVLRLKGEGREGSVVIGDESLEGSVFDVRMKYNFFMNDMKVEHRGKGSCVDALFVKAFDCSFEGNAKNGEPVLRFHGSNCWAVRCDFFTENTDSYGISYTRLPGEISINDYIIDNTFRGNGKGVLVGDGVAMKDGRCEGLKIIGNDFENSGATAVEVYEILHVNIAYNTFKNTANAIFLSNLGHGPDGIYIDHNVGSSSGSVVTSGRVEGGGDYISMVVIHDNEFTSGAKDTVSEPVAFNKKMIHE